MRVCPLPSGHAAGRTSIPQPPRPSRVRRRHWLFAAALGSLLAASAWAAASPERPTLRVARAGESFISTEIPAGTGAPANPWFESQRLEGSANANRGDQFGRGVAVEGSTAIVGAPITRATGTTSSKGAAYVYTLQGDQWVETQFLTGSQQSSGNSSDNYGWAVALQGDTAVVSAKTSTLGGVQRGIAYVYVRESGTWIEQGVLIPGDGGQFDDFGDVVAIDGDTVVVGARGHRPQANAYEVGAAYVFTRSGGIWTQQAKLMADDSELWAGFGASVAIDGDHLLVGRTGRSDYPRIGTVYAFSRTGTTWTQTQRIHRTDGVANDYFGTSVALDGDTALVGAIGTATNGDYSGAVHALQRTGGVWTQVQTLAAADAQPLDQFGQSLVLHGDRVVIGAPAASRAFNLEGRAYLFSRGSQGWTQERLLTNSAPRRGETFGFGLGLTEEFAFVGAPFWSGASGFTGTPTAVIVFRNTDRPYLYVDPATLALQPTAAGYTSPVGIATIGNSGQTSALVTAIDVPAGPFSLVSGSCGTLPFSLAPGAQCTLGFTFSPPSVQSYSAAVQISSNALNKAVTLSLSGAGIPPRALLSAVDPAAVSATMTAGATSSATVTLANGGTAALDWQMVDQASDPTVSVLLEPGVSDTILPENTLACLMQGPVSAPAHFFRTFALSDFAVDGAFAVEQVEFGIEQASVATDVTVRLHRLDGPMSFENLDLLAETIVHVEPQALSMVTVPIAADLPAGTTLVVELITPDLRESSGVIIPGSNQSGESAASWFAAPACGYAQPTAYSSMFGFPPPVVHLVLSASGHPIDCAVPQWLDADPQSGGIAPFSSSTFSVQMDSSGLSIGEHTANLCITSNAANRPLVALPVSVHVEEPVATLALDPGTADFGGILVGSSSGALAVSLSSTGNTPVTIDAIAAASAPFHAAPGSCPAAPFTLAPAQTCELVYTFSPLEAGIASQTLAVTSSAGDHTLVLRGEGLAPAALAMIDGSGQVARVGAPFERPLVLQVRDGSNRPLAGVPVMFSAPGQGAGASLPASSLVSDANGIVSVTAVANSQAGDYIVEASVSGDAAPLAFALSNRLAAADIAVQISALDAYAVPGRFVDYWVTLHNAGPDAASSIQLEMSLSAALDASATQWICIGPASSGCTAGGAGALSDSVNLVAGGSVSWLVTAPVRLDTTEAGVLTSVQVVHADDPNGSNDAASIFTVTALFRDGFEPYGIGSEEVAAPVPASRFWESADVLSVNWTGPAQPQPAHSAMIATLMESRAADAASAGSQFRIEHLAASGGDWLRLVSIETDGMARAQPWQAASPAGAVMIAAVREEGAASGRSGTLVVSARDGIAEWQATLRELTPVYALRHAANVGVSVMSREPE